MLHHNFYLNHIGLELCKRHNVVDAEEFVDTWMAYSVSYLGGEGPNETNLIKFERENYIKKPAACTKSSETISTKSLPAVYGGSSMKERYFLFYFFSNLIFFILMYFYKLTFKFT